MFAAVTLLFPSDITRERMADTGTVVYRVQIWAAGIGMVADHPLLGVGFGQFIKHVGDYEQLTGIPQVTDPAGLADLAHNTTLSVAAELGLIGLTLYIVILTGMFRTASAAAHLLWGRRGKEWIGAFTIVYLVNSQFVTSHELVPNILYFGVMGAVAGYSGAGARSLRPPRLRLAEAPHGAPGV
jgi:hypothetical protein